MKQRSYAAPLPLPALELDYSRPVLSPQYRTVDPESLRNLPVGVDGRAYQLLDLDGEGLPGVYSEQAGALYYKRNLGDGRFGPLERLATKPSIANLANGFQQLTDLDGSGEKALVQLGTEPQGYFARAKSGWKPFRSFKSLPNLNWRDPSLRFLDLDGDGLPDVLKPEGELFRLWPSLGKDGYGPEQRVRLPRDEERGPYIVFTDPRQAIAIADMTGDGLSDLVRIRNGSVDYWPNRGYGHFDAKVVMRNAPRFDHADQFNPKYLRLADVDGSGTADLVYLDASGAQPVRKYEPYFSPTSGYESIIVEEYIAAGQAAARAALR